MPGSTGQPHHDREAVYSRPTIYVSSGGLAVKPPALGANGHRFEPCKRSKPFQRN